MIRFSTPVSFNNNAALALQKLGKGTKILARDVNARNDAVTLLKALTKFRQLAPTPRFDTDKAMCSRDGTKLYNN